MIQTPIRLDKHESQHLPAKTIPAECYLGLGESTQAFLIWGVHRDSVHSFPFAIAGMLWTLGSSS